MSNSRTPNSRNWINPIVVASALALLALLAFCCSSVAAMALPFAVGGAAGYYLAYFATSTGYPSLVHAIAGFLAALCVAVLGLTLISNLTDLELPTQIRPLFNINETTGLFTNGFLLAFFIIMVRQLAFSETAEEARERRRSVARGTLMVSGLFALFMVIVLVIYAVLALIAYVVGTFAD